MSISSHLIRSLLIGAAVATLAGCSSDPTTDLAEYATQVKNQQKSSIEPLPEFKPYESFIYMLL